MLARRQLIHVADLCAKEAKDFDLHLIQTCDQLLNLTFNLHPDTFDPFQHLKHPSQRRSDGLWGG